MKRIGLVCLLVSLIFFSSRATYAARDVPDHTEPLGRLVLSETSKISIVTWLGTATCRSGQVFLVSPKETKIISSNAKPPTTPKPKKTVVVPDLPGTVLVHNYGEGINRVEIGPYPAGTELILGIHSESFCQTTRTLTESFYTKVTHNGGGNSWTIGWEDYRDNDRDDVFTEVTFIPVKETVIDSPFNPNSVYKLPWPSGITHKATQSPGRGHHKNTLAYDFDMKVGDKVVASESGVVLWIEDSFGTGACQDKYRSSVNVVVIQTEPGVNLTYVHLQKGSVKKAGLKVGDRVTQGQWIGNAGKSGFVCSETGSGSHLHIEWQKNCYSLEQSQKRRTLKDSRVGEATLAWSCPSFSPKYKQGFTVDGKLKKINPRDTLTSDNTFGK